MEKIWAWFFIGEELYAAYRWPEIKNLIKESDPEIKSKFRGMEPGDKLLVYAYYRDNGYDGILEPGSKLYGELMALVLTGEAQLMEVGD